MSANFQIDFKHENGELFVDPVGDLDGSSACELINLLVEQYDGHGRVHIDTRRLRHLCPFGCSTFRCQFYRSRVPVERLLLKGENSRALAPDNSHVHGPGTPHACQCNGRCTHCRCAERPGSQTMETRRRSA